MSKYLDKRADPRNAETLADACGNGDGTYNGFELMSWLSEALHPGKGLSVAEVKKCYEEAVRRRAAKK